MPLLILAMAATLATAAADAAPAVTSAPTPVAGVAVPGAAPKAEKDPNKVVCHREEITGSRFVQRVCRTNAQWDQAEQNAATYKREIEDRNGLQGKQVGPFGN